MKVLKLKLRKWTFVLGMIPRLVGAAEPDNYQAYVTVTIKKTKEPPHVNEKRVEEALNGTSALSAKSEEKIEFQISEKEAE